MAEARICGSCGQEASVGGYRTAATREAEPVEKPVKAPRVVLEEENDEAENDSTGWGVGAAGSWGCTGFFGAVWASNTNPGWGVVTLCALVFAVVCVVGYLRCRATIAAWREQKRKAVPGA
jgi:hypothetical protein